MASACSVNIIKVCGIKMDRNLESYVKIYDNWIDADKCKQTIKELESTINETVLC